MCVTSNISSQLCLHTLGTTPNLYINKLLNKSEIWAASQRSGTRLETVFLLFLLSSACTVLSVTAFCLLSQILCFWPFLTLSLCLCCPLLCWFCIPPSFSWSSPPPPPVLAWHIFACKDVTTSSGLTLSQYVNQQVVSAERCSLKHVSQRQLSFKQGAERSCVSLPVALLHERHTHKDSLCVIVGL